MSFSEYIKNHKAIPHIATDIINTPSGDIIATNVQTAINELDTEKVPYIGGTGNVDIGDFELRAQTLEADVVTGTAPLTIASTTKVTNLNADLLDGLHDTGYTKTTAGQTINATTSAEVTTAMSLLASAPSLLGNIEVAFAAGTYADAITIPSLIGNGYSLTLSGGTTTNVSTAATGGTAGDVNTQSTVVKAAAGWTVNAYRGQWLKFTSGALNGFIRQINSNTADTITLIGGFFSSAPQNNDTFIVYANSASITGKISFSHSTSDLNFVNLDIGELIGKMATVKLTECKQTVSGYVNYEIDLCDIRYYRSYILVTADASGLWMVTTDVVFYSCHIRGFSTTPVAQWGMLLQGGGITIIRCGTVIENHGWGIWSQIGGSSNCNSGSEDDSSQNPNATNSIIKNNGTGILAQKGGHAQVDLTVFSGNTTDKTAEAASYSWIE